MTAESGTDGGGKEDVSGGDDGDAGGHDKGDMSAGTNEESTDASASASKAAELAVTVI